MCVNVCTCVGMFMSEIEVFIYLPCIMNYICRRVFKICGTIGLMDSVDMYFVADL